MINVSPTTAYRVRIDVSGPASPTTAYRESTTPASPTTAYRERTNSQESLRVTEYELSVPGNNLTAYEVQLNGRVLQPENVEDLLSLGRPLSPSSLGEITVKPYTIKYVKIFSGE